MGAIAKCVLILINSVFLVISLAFTAVGAILTFMPGKVLDKVYDDVKDSIPTNAPYTIPDDADGIGDVPFFKTLGIALLVFGVILFVIAFLAFFGACCTTCCRCLLILYAVVVILFMVVEIVVGVMFLVEGSPLHDETREKLKDLIKTDYKDDGDDAFSMSMNLIHQHFDCCGIDSSADFGAKTHRSCESAYLTTGCYSKLQDVIQDNLVWCSLGLAALVILQLVEVYCAISIFKEATKIMPI